MIEVVFAMFTDMKIDKDACYPDSSTKKLTDNVGPTDEFLWVSYLNGDKHAFDQLYRRYYSLLLHYGCKFSQDQELVQDCIQDLFMELMLKSKNLSVPLSVKAYMLRSFRNNLLKSLEKEGKRYDFVLVDDIPEMLHTATEEKDSFKDDLKDLLLAYQKLSVKQKEVLYLFYVKGLSHKEISNVLYINYQSSKNRLCQSLVQLRKLFFQIKK